MYVHVRMNHGRGEYIQALVLAAHRTCSTTVCAKYVHQRVSSLLGRSCIFPLFSLYTASSGGGGLCCVRVCLGRCGTGVGLLLVESRHLLLQLPAHTVHVRLQSVRLQPVLGKSLGATHLSGNVLTVC